MKRIASGLAIAAIVAFAGPADAGTTTAGLNASAPPSQSFDCGGAAQDCMSISPNNPTGPGSSITVYVLLTGIRPGPGSGGATSVGFGIDTSSSGNVTPFTEGASAACLGIEIHDDTGPNGPWPASGSGVSVAFGACISPATEGGVIPVYRLNAFGSPGSGQMQFAPSPNGGLLEYTDCNNATVAFPGPNLGTFGFGPDNGASACQPPVPNEEKSWGQIKALF